MALLAVSVLFMAGALFGWFAAFYVMYRADQATIASLRAVVRDQRSHAGQPGPPMQSGAHGVHTKDTIGTLTGSN